MQSAYDLIIANKEKERETRALFIRDEFECDGKKIQGVPEWSECMTFFRLDCKNSMDSHRILTRIRLFRHFYTLRFVTSCKFSITD